MTSSTFLSSAPAGCARHAIRVRYGDTDQASVVHHAAYLAYFEEARIEHQRARGLDYRAFEAESGLGLPVVAADLRYRAPARFDDLVHVQSWVESITRARVVYAQRVVRSETVLVEARITLAAVHLAEARLVSIPARVAEACSRA
ncbi:MAG: thioesterase family protein [Sandaracinus sp.]